MAGKSIKEKVEEAGHKIAETATKVGHQVQKLEEATGLGQEKADQAGIGSRKGTEKAEHKAKEFFGEGGEAAGATPPSASTWT